jgi:sugar phosphate permease
VFFVCGSIGFIWVVAWYRFFRDEPMDHPSISRQEAEKIMLERKLPAAHGEQRGTFRRILRLPSFFPICLMYIANAYGFYFLITWFPTYLATARGFSQTQLGIFSGLPLMMGVMGVLSGGWTTDRLARRFGLRIGRCAVGFSAYLLATAAMVGGAAASGPRTAAFLIALATGASMFTVPASWATCIDIGGRHSGVLSAAMNTSGQIGGILSPIVLAYLVDTFGDWSLPLYVLAGLHLIGAFCWLLIRPDHPLQAPAAN